MLPLHHLLDDFTHVSPYDLMVIVFVLTMNVWKEVKSRCDRRKIDPGAPARKPEGLLDRLKALAIDTVDALAIIACIWLVGKFLGLTLQEERKMGGISLSGLMDCAHFAVVFNWLLHCLRRTMP